MRYTTKEGNTLKLNEAVAADSFIEADLYICEPLEMYFNAKGELRAGKRQGAVAPLLCDD